MKKLLLSLLVAAMAFLPAQAQLNEVLHEGFEGGVMPAGWTQEYVKTPITLGVDTPAYSWNVESGENLAYPRGAANGTGRVAARNSSTDEMQFVTRLATPVLNLSGLFRPILSFQHAEPALAGSSDTLRVLYRTTQNEVWRPLPGAVYTRNAGWKQATVDLIGATSTYQLAFEITENMGYGVVLDEVVVGPTPTCEDVEDVHAVDVHSYDATLIWTEKGYYDHFEVLVTAVPVTDFNNIPENMIAFHDETVYNTSVMLTNLQPEVQYYAYVRSDCDENESGFTDWATGSFMTRAVAYLPYVQSFNSIDDYAGRMYFGLPHGWTCGSSVSDSLPCVYRGGARADNAKYSVDSTAYLSFSSAMKNVPEPLAVGAYAYAASPEVITSSIQDVEVEFWATAYDKVTMGTSEYASSLIVGLMTNPSDFSTFVPVDTIHINSSYLFQRYTVSLANYAGAGKYVTLASYFGARNAIYVDNFSLRQAEVAAPTHVQVSNVRPAGMTVSADVHNADSWNLVVSTEYNATGEVSPASILYTANSLTGSSHDVLVADSSFAGQIVMVYVQTVKNGATSAWSFPVTRRVPTHMSVPYLNTCESSTGLISLTSLDNEIHSASPIQAMASVFYPLSAITNDVKQHPVLESTQPNYQGSHARLEGVDSWFVLPEVDALNTLKLVFRYAAPANMAGAVAVGVMTDPYDLSTFEQVATFRASISEYRRGLVSFDTYQGQGKYIAFRGVNANVAVIGQAMLIDNIQVEELGDCREASNVSAVVNSNDATITWNGGGMDGWIVGLGTKRSMMGATHDTVYTPQYTFTDLDAETTYYYTIQSVCGDSLLDLDNVFYEFHTPRGLPFVEKFQTSSMPEGWTQASCSAASVFNGAEVSGTSNYWNVSSGTIYTPQAGYGARMNVYSTNRYGWLMSPVLDLPEVESVELTFDVAIAPYSSSASAGSDDVFGVLISLDGGNTWQRQNATLWTNDGMGDYVLDDLPFGGAQSVSILCPQCSGQSVQIAFYGESTASNADIWISVDNISLHVADARCGGLTNLRAMATDGHNANISWTLNGSNPYPAYVEVSPFSSFSNPIFSDTVVGSSLALTNLQSSTRYYVRARQLCPAGSDWVTKSFATACDAKTPEEFGEEDFSRSSVLDCWTVGFAYDNGSGTLPRQVTAQKFGGVLEITKDAVSETASDGAYAVSPEFNIPDSMNHYQVVFRAGAFGSNDKNVCRIQVGVTTDPSDAVNTFEPMATLRLAKATDSLSMKTYVVSLEDYMGDYNENYGRYIMFLSETGADSTNFVYIDNVMLEPAQGCHMVLNADVDNETEEGARISWTGNGDAYQVMLTRNFAKADTVVDPLVLTTIDSISYTFTGLIPNTTYYVYLRTICGNDSSRWSSPTAFRTKYGIFFEDWDDKGSIAAAGWTQGNAQFGNSVVSTAAMSTSTVFSLTSSLTNTSSLTISNVEGQFARANVWSSSKYHWLMSPAIDLTTVETGAMLTLRLAVYPYGSGSAASASTDKRFAIVISEDGGLTWNPSNATIWDCNTTGEYNFRSFNEHAKSLSVDLSKYVGNTIKVGLYSESTGSSTDLYYAIDSIGIAKYIAECLGIRNLKVEMTASDAAEATWHHISIPELAKLEMATDAAFTNIVLTADSLTETSYSLTDLQPNHTYYVRVQQLGCASTQPAIAQFNTPKVIPYEDAFSSLSGDWTVMKGNVIKAFHDTLPQPNASSAWRIGSDVLGTPHLIGELYVQSIENEFWLVSPEVILNAADEDDLELSFELGITAAGKDTAYSDPTKTDDQQLRVLLSTDGGASWSEDNQWIFANNTTDAVMTLSELTAEPTKIRLDITDYKNERVRVAFYKESVHPKNDNMLHIRNLHIGLQTIDCDPVANLAVDSTSFTIAELSWESTAEQHVVEYGRLADMSDAVSDTISGTTCLLQNLKPASIYYVHVKAICGENASSNWSELVEVHTSLGLPYAAALNGRNDWDAFTTADGVPVVNPTFTATSATAGWRLNGTSGILNGTSYLSCAHNTKSFWIVSPEIDLTPNTSEAVIAMSVDLALTSGFATKSAPASSATNGKRFYVMVSTDNGVTWAESNRWKFSDDADAQYTLKSIPNAAGKTYEFDITRFGGEKIRVALVLEGSTKKSFAVHAANFQVYALHSNCFGVSNVVVNSVDTLANLTLTPNDAATQWQVAYGKSGSDIEAMKYLNTTDVNVSFPVELNSQYDVYARSICAVGDTSAWFGPLAVATPLGLTYVAEMHNSFDGWTRYLGDTTAVFGGAALTTTTKGWTATSSTVVLGEEHINVTKNAAETYWLVSPEINLMPQHDTEKSIYLSMDLALTGSATSAMAPTNVKDHSFCIAFSTDNGTTWSAANTILFADSTADYVYASIPNGEGRSYHFDVTKYAGQVVRMALVMGKAATGASTLHVNNIELAEYDVPCFGVAQLSASVKNGITTITIVPGDSATTWQYTYVAPGAQPTNENVYTVDTTTFNTTALPFNQTWNIYVRSLCGSNDTSAWAGPATVKMPNGVPYLETFSDMTLPDDWNTYYSYSTYTGLFVENYDRPNPYWLGSANLVTGNGLPGSHAWVNMLDDNSYYSSNGSTNVMLVSPEISLANLDGKSIALNFDLAFTADRSPAAATAADNQMLEIRVSTDNGATWDDVLMKFGESEDCEFSLMSVPSTGDNYLADLSMYAGEQIRLGFFAYAKGSNADNDIHLDNVQVDTISGSMCAPVRRVKVVEAGLQQMTLLFSAPGIMDARDIQYIFQLHDNLFNPNLAQHTDTNVVTVTGLMSSTRYDVYIKTICEDGTVNDWNGPFVVETAECAPITGIAECNLTMSDATFTLATKNATAAVAYQVCMTEHEGALDENEIITSATNQFAFAREFESATPYDIYARRICEVGDTTDWFGPFVVRTPFDPDLVIYQNALNATSLPTGWECYTTSSSVIPTEDDQFATSTSGWSVGTRHGVFDAEHAYINIYSSNKYLLASAPIDLSTADAGVSMNFDLALTDYNNANAPVKSPAGRQRFEIRVSTDNGSSWQMVDAWDNNTGHTFEAIPTTGETYTVNLSQYAGYSNVRLGFYSCSYVSGSDNDLHLANIVVYKTSQPGPVVTCLALDSVRVRNVDLNSATLNAYFHDGDGKQALYEVATDRNFNYIVVSDTIHPNQTVQLTGLSASTTYYVHAKNLCGQNEESRWSGTVSFTTELGVRYFEDFNGNAMWDTWTRYSGSAASVFNGTGRMATSSSGWTSNTPTGAAGMQTKHPKLNVYGSTCTYWMVSPTINLEPNASDALLLAFDVALCKYNNPGTPAAPAPDDQFIVAISENDGQTWSRSNAFVWDNKTSADARRQGSYSNDLTETPQRIMLDMSQYGGKRIRIAFYGESTVTNGDNDLHIDNVELNATASYTYYDTICSSAGYQDYGFSFAENELTSGSHKFNRVSAEMDSVVYLHLFVKQSYQVTYTDTICEGEIYNEYGFNVLPTESSMLRRRLASVEGCDSLVVVDLTVLPKKYETVNLYACLGTSYNLLGKTYYSNAIIRDTVQAAITGCDSIITYRLSFSDQPNYTEYISTALCLGDTLEVGNYKFTQQGKYRVDLQSMGGCDSTVFVTLLTVDIQGNAYDTVSVKDLPYTYDGRVLLDAGVAPGDYRLNIRTACGTAGIINLTVVDTHEGWRDMFDGEHIIRKVVVDDQLFIIVDDSWYDAMGRVVKLQ